MPQGDRFRSIQIGVDPIAAIAALETRLIQTDTQMQTSRTGLRRVPWVDINDFHSCAGRLVADHPLQLGKTPFVNAFRLAGFTNSVEVFKDNPLIVRPGVTHDLFADAVIGVRDKTSLSTRDTRKRPLGALAAVGLERSSRPLWVEYPAQRKMNRNGTTLRFRGYEEAAKSISTEVWQMIYESNLNVGLEF
jgi:hypothetical protein